MRFTKPRRQDATPSGSRSEIVPGVAVAAAAAGVPQEGCLLAARDPARDRPLWATARGLHARGVQALPALRIGRLFIEGERILIEGAALLGAHAL